jgi:hypothetical protein
MHVCTLTYGDGYAAVFCHANYQAWMDLKARQLVGRR